MAFSLKSLFELLQGWIGVVVAPLGPPSVSIQIISNELKVQIADKIDIVIITGVICGNVIL